MIIRILAAAVAAALIGVGAYLWTPPPPTFDASAAKAAARNYDARIVRDAFGVPHIFGKRDADAAFGLAYAHAEDDMETMEEVILFVRGRLGQKTGKDGAITDYLVAALGAREDVAAKYETDLSPGTRAVLEGYAAGVNLYCAEARDRCSPGVAPVSGPDILTGFVARTPFFYGLEEQLTALFADDKKAHAALEQARTAFLDLPPTVETGSNAMAVAPSRAADGHTRLMVNSHQPYTGPVAWYEAHVKSEEGWDRIGGVFPGSPVILHGAGPDNGWAFTVNKPDLVDIYALEVDDSKKPRRYRFDGAWRDFDRSDAKFRVKLLGPFSLPVSRPVLRSVHGPAFMTPRGVFAVAFAGKGDVKAAEQWYRMNKARDFASWRDAMAIQGIPSFNVVYADKTGNIAYFYNAAIPVRAAGADWSKTQDGSDPALVWQGVRPFGSAPSVVNPASGYVANANNNPFEASSLDDSPKAEEFPAEFGIDHRQSNRGFRQHELFGEDASITAEEFLAYKMDNAYSARSKLVGIIDTLAADPALSSDPETKAAVDLLKTWDRSAARESRAAALAIRIGCHVYNCYASDQAGDTPDPVEALQVSMREMQATFGRLDPPWSEAMRLDRGDKSLEIDGGPDTLRAVYPDVPSRAGRWSAGGGDTYVLYADWSPEGAASIQTIHQFGSATLDKKSPHYADQAPLFAAEQWKTPPMTLDAALAEATRDYRPGRGD